MGTPAGDGPAPVLTELTERAVALCVQAAAAGRDSPAEETRVLAAQLDTVGRLLSQALRAGSVAAAAYERGRLDERAHPAV